MSPKVKLAIIAAQWLIDLYKLRQRRKKKRRPRRRARKKSK